MSVAMRCSADRLPTRAAHLVNSTSFHQPPVTASRHLRLMQSRSHTGHISRRSPASHSPSIPAASTSSRLVSDTDDVHVPRSAPPPLLFAPSTQNCAFGGAGVWPPLNWYCLPFCPNYSSALAPFMSAHAQSEHPAEMISPMHNLLTRLPATYPAHVPPLLGGLLPTQRAQFFSLTGAHTQLSSSAPEVSVQRGRAVMEVRRVSCDSTVTSVGGGSGSGGLESAATSSESTSSPRHVSSTSDDNSCQQQTPVDHLSVVTGSLSFHVIIFSLTVAAANSSKCTLRTLLTLNSTEF